MLRTCTNNSHHGNDKYFGFSHDDQRRLLHSNCEYTDERKENAWRKILAMLHLNADWLTSSSRMKFSHDFSESFVRKSGTRHHTHPRVRTHRFHWFTRCTRVSRIHSPSVGHRSKSNNKLDSFFVWPLSPRNQPMTNTCIHRNSIFFSNSIFRRRVFREAGGSGVLPLSRSERYTTEHLYV